MKNLHKNLFLLLLVTNVTIAQYSEGKFALSTNFNFNTTAKIFLNPDADVFTSQTDFFEIEDIFSYSFELRYGLLEYLILGLSFEYMQGEASGRNLTNRSFVVKDGFELYPIELSAYYFLPFSTEDFKFYMGGGIGYYTGYRTREFGDINFKDVNSQSTFGIQVSSGMDYMIFDFLSVRGELRFRDPELIITNKYTSDQVTYEGSNYSVTQENIRSRLNVDGITFRIGMVYHFLPN